jgi:hypothetical protein
MLSAISVIVWVSGAELGEGKLRSGAASTLLLLLSSHADLCM